VLIELSFAIFHHLRSALDKFPQLAMRKFISYRNQNTSSV